MVASCCSLIPLPTIRHEDARVKNELVGIIRDLLAGVQRQAGVGVRYIVGIRYGVVDLSPGNLNQDIRRVCIAETLVVLKPVGVRDDNVRRKKVSQ